MKVRFINGKFTYTNFKTMKNRTFTAKFTAIIIALIIPIILLTVDTETKGKLSNILLLSASPTNVAIDTIIQATDKPLQEGLIIILHCTTTEGEVHKFKGKTKQECISKMSENRPLPVYINITFYIYDTTTGEMWYI